MAKIKPKETPEIADAVTRIVIPLSKMPAAMAGKIRESGRATIQRLLSSYVRRKRAMPSVTSKAAPGAVPFATETPVSASSAKPLSSAQDPGTMTSHDFDVTMADSTFTFGNTIRMDDPGGGYVTTPSCAASVPIPEERSKSIEKELKASSGTIADTDMGTYDLLPRPIGIHETLRPQVTIRSPLVPIRTQDTHDQNLHATRPHQIR